jgi:hypothetical protein
MQHHIHELIVLFAPNPMCKCVCACVCVHVCVCVFVCVHGHHVCSVCLSARVRLRACVCMYKRMPVNVCVVARVMEHAVSDSHTPTPNILVCVCVCVCVCMCREKAATCAPRLVPELDQRIRLVAAFQRSGARRQMPVSETRATANCSRGSITVRVMPKQSKR